MFEKIPLAPADPILGLAEIYQSDTRAEKINLGIGVYKNDTGVTPILNCVKNAEHTLLESESTKNYLRIEGSADFARYTQQLLFGKHLPSIVAGGVRTAQTPGGTGALRVAADFLHRHTPVKRVWISDPSWPNHQKVFNTAGLEVAFYPYYDAVHHTLDFPNMLACLEQAQAGDAVILHGCCHNPTGLDPTLAQWQQLADLAGKNRWLPLFDFAYQGFAHGLEEDAAGMHCFATRGLEMLIASSYSKNFGLYNERVGALTLLAEDARSAECAFSQIKSTIRANYSNPPAHGANIVSTILRDDKLRSQWEQELATMRERIQHMRQLFVHTLVEKGAKQDFAFITRQNGMFSFSGLTPEQVLQLRDEYAIYAVSSGRVNVAGMTSDNMSRLCKAIIAVL